MAEARHHCIYPVKRGLRLFVSRIGVVPARCVEVCWMEPVWRMHLILNSVEHFHLVGSRGGFAAPTISFLLRRAALPRAATKT